MLGRIFTVGGYTLLSRLTGFASSIMLAAILGAGPIADAFFVALRLPNSFRAIFAEGAFNTAFIPAYAHVHGKDGESENLVFIGIVPLERTAIGYTTATRAKATAGAGAVAFVRHPRGFGPEEPPQRNLRASLVPQYRGLAQGSCRLRLRWHNPAVTRPFPCHSRIRQPVQPCRGRLINS